MKRMLLALVVLGLAGCATHAPRQSDVRSPDPDRVMLFQSANAGDGTIIVTRDAGFLGGGCYMALYIDGALAAKLDTGERATFHVPAGHHVLGTWQIGKALCGYRADTDRREVDASLAPGEMRKYRVIIDNGGVKLEPTSL